VSATEGRTASQELSETRLRAFVDAVLDAYYGWHVQTGYMEMSHQMDSLPRLRPGALPRSFHAWLDRVHPDDRQATLINNQRAIEDGGIYDGEYRLRRGDGRSRQAATSVSRPWCRAAEPHRRCPRARSRRRRRQHRSVSERPPWHG